MAQGVDPSRRPHAVGHPAQNRPWRARAEWLSRRGAVLPIPHPDREPPCRRSVAQRRALVVEPRGTRRRASKSENL
jgi:hypothetical protein